MYSTNNEGKSVVAKAYKNFEGVKYMRKRQLIIVNHISINWISQQTNIIILNIILLTNKLLLLTILLWLKRLRGILKLLNLKLVAESELLRSRTFPANVISKTNKESYLLLIPFWKLVLGHKKLKIQSVKK